MVDAVLILYMLIYILGSELKLRLRWAPCTYKDKPKEGLQRLVDPSSHLLVFMHRGPTHVSLKHYTADSNALMKSCCAVSWSNWELDPKETLLTFHSFGRRSSA